MERQIIIYTRIRVKSVCAQKVRHFPESWLNVVSGMCSVFFYLGVR